MKRISFDEAALKTAFVWAERSEDPYVKVGACALRHDNSVCGVGYNGAPPGITIDWSDRETRRKFVLHAEENCLNYCSPGECKLIAVTTMPCGECIKLIAAKRIKTVLFSKVYDRDKSAIEIADKFGIELIHYTLSN